MLHVKADSTLIAMQNACLINYVSCKNIRMLLKYICRTSVFISLACYLEGFPVGDQLNKHEQINYLSKHYSFRNRKYPKVPPFVRISWAAHLPTTALPVSARPASTMYMLCRYTCLAL